MSLWKGLKRENAPTPLYRQVYERLREAITTGTLHPGERLPSARALASQLSTARGTIDAAYDLLSTQGYIVSRGAAGTRVAPNLAAISPSAKRTAAKKSATLPAPAKVSDWPIPPAIKPFQMGVPALDAFPTRLWAKLAARRARELTPHALMQTDPLGHRPLREAIAAYLAVARGIQCSSDSVVITSGFQGALGLITHTLLNRSRPTSIASPGDSTDGDEVWVEDPGYPHNRRALELAGAKVIGVPVDAQGMDVAAGIARAPRARLAVVTPTHQAPLGVALDLSRRLALLAWARQADAWIIEDDYDGEYRYESKPLPALKSLDDGDRVLYVGTFSKVLFPGLRLGYLVLPESLVEPFTRMSYGLYWNGATLISSVLTDFMTEGHFARHIKKMRQLYAERRAALAAALNDGLSDYLSLRLEAGGMHLLAMLKHPLKDIEVQERGNSQGLALAALSRWNVERDNGQGLLLSFTNIQVESAKREVKRLAGAIQSVAGVT
jgi:GntR family transcriptional regulator / MocR family aminotransferase